MRFHCRSGALLTSLVLQAVAGPCAVRAAELPVYPGALDVPLQVLVRNTSDIIWLHDVMARADSVPVFISAIEPPEAPAVPASVGPGGSSAAEFTFDVDEAAEPGATGWLALRAFSSTGDSAQARVRVTVSALTPAVTLPFATDFEASPSGLLGTGSWEWGLPTAPPGAAASGFYAWATNLDGDYDNDAEDLLYLPPLDLSSAVAPRLSFAHWHDMEWSYDGGVVQVSADSGATFVEVPPLEGYPGEGSVGGTPAFTGRSDEGTAYRTATFHLGAFSGGTAVVRLVLATDGSVTRPGWAVDDVLVQEGPAVEAAVIEIDAPDAIEAPWPGGVSLAARVANLGSGPLSFVVRAEVDSTAEGAGASAAAFADSTIVGPLAPGDSSDVSFALPLPSLGFVPYTARVTAVAPGDGFGANDARSVDFLLLPVVELPVAEPFENPASPSQGAGTGAWERGAPTGGPGAAFEGSACWGASLAGGYPMDHGAELHLGAFDLQEVDRPVLRFRHWFDLEPGYDGGLVSVSTDGSTWTVVRPKGGYTAPVAAFAGDSAWTGTSDGWVVAELDLTAFTGSPVVVARLALATDGSGAGAGWFVDSLTVRDVPAAGAEEGSGGAPRILALSIPSPCPSGGPTRLSVSLPVAGRVRLEVFSVEGRRVALLLDAWHAAGVQSILWNGRDEDGRLASSGVYLFRMETQGATMQRRAVVLR